MRLTILLLLILVLAFGGEASALQYPNCSILTVSPVAGVCYDSTTNVVWVWDGQTSSMIKLTTSSGLVAASALPAIVPKFDPSYVMSAETRNGMALSLGL